MFKQSDKGGQQAGNNLLRYTMLIIFGLANLNNGLTSDVTYDTISNELHRKRNQNLIMSPGSAGISGSTINNYNGAVSQLLPIPATGHGGSIFHSSYSGTFTAPSDIPYPPSSISASSSSHYHNPGAGVGGAFHNSLDGATQGSLAEGGLEEIYTAPMYFGTENSTVVMTQIGATAHIPCTVHHIGDGVVSWLRKKDYHLLTVGLTTYSSDERFSATHLKHSEDWTLQIKFVQLRDAGVYECQVSTHPPTSIFLHLNVVEARAEISGPPIRYLTPGSTLRLHCRVVQNTEASEFIFWYHDNRMINYDSDRGINVSTDPDFQSSELTIQRTRREHSGNFTCVASNTQPASVLVHIFKGDNPAAMYHGHVGVSTKSYQKHLLGITAVIVMTYRILQIHVHVNLV